MTDHDHQQYLQKMLAKDYDPHYEWKRWTGKAKFLTQEVRDTFTEVHNLTPTILTPQEIHDIKLFIQEIEADAQEIVSISQMNNDDDGQAELREKVHALNAKINMSEDAWSVRRIYDLARQRGVIFS